MIKEILTSIVFILCMAAVGSIMWIPDRSVIQNNPTPPDQNIEIGVQNIPPHE